MSVQGLEFQNFSSRYAVVEANHRSGEVQSRRVNNESNDIQPN